MRNLIFVSKYIGLECLKFHLNTFRDDQNYIVVCNPEKEEIISYLSKCNVECLDVDFFSINDLKGKKFDWLINLWGGYIFHEDLLSLVKNSLNIHPSYLPYGRGRDPVVWAIRDGVPAGVTLHEINEQVDEGDIWYQEKVPYTLPITGQELYKKVVNVCIAVFQEHWPNIRDFRYRKMPQLNMGLTTKKRKDLFHDQIIDFDRLGDEQKELFLRVLAHDFGENYSALLKVNNTEFKIKILFSES